MAEHTPLVSIVVPAYNAANKIGPALTSLRNQSHRELEIIVVDDASTDNTAEVLAAVAAKEPRLKVITQPTNGGTLRARAAGAAATTGDYVMFLDQDDEYLEDAVSQALAAALEHQVDIVHFGARVEPENAAAQDAAEGMELFLNPPARTLRGAAILRQQFALKGGFDWQIHHKLYRGDLARRAYALAADEYLLLSDDLYVSAIISALATSYVALPDSQWMVYHLGLGQTFGTTMTIEAFDVLAARDATAARLIAEFAASADAPARKDWPQRLEDITAQLASHTVNQWRDTVPTALRPQAMATALTHWPARPIAAELYRLCYDGALAAYHTLREMTNLGIRPTRDPAVSLPAEQASSPALREEYATLRAKYLEGVKKAIYYRTAAARTEALASDSEPATYPRLQEMRSAALPLMDGGEVHYPPVHLVTEKPAERNPLAPTVPSLSIVLTTRNNADTLPTTLASIDAALAALAPITEANPATPSRVSIIAVDDASSDSTARLLEEWAASHAGSPSTITVVQQTNDPSAASEDTPYGLGKHAARSLGLSRATGEYVLFLTGDQALSENTLAEALLLNALEVPVIRLAGGTPRLPGWYARPQMAEVAFGGTSTDWSMTRRIVRRSALDAAFAQLNAVIPADEGVYDGTCTVEFFALLPHVSGEYVSGVPGVVPVDAHTHHTSGAAAADQAALETTVNSMATIGHAVAALDTPHTPGALRAIALRAASAAFAFDAHAAVAAASLTDQASTEPSSVQPTLPDALATIEIFAGPAITVETLLALAIRARKSENGSDAVATTAPGASARELFDAAVDIASANEEWLTPEALELKKKYLASAKVPPVDRGPAPTLNPDINIFVSSHLDAKLFDSKYHIPVHVGSAVRDATFSNMLRDDEGENISIQNFSYCELTTQYWAWKNVDAEYYGFCHYRRYFNFSNILYKENPWGEIDEETINAASQKKYGLTDDNIARLIRRYDVVTTEIKSVAALPGPEQNPREHWYAADWLKNRDLDAMLKIINRLSPEYNAAAQEFITGGHAAFCNMFVMRKELFHNYCAWSFPILEAYQRETNYLRYGREARRTAGHLAERLFNIWLLHERKSNPGLRVKEVQCVHFHDVAAQRVTELPSLAPATSRPIVPIVLAADDNYVPMLGTTIESVLENSSPANFYDLIVLTKDISDANRAVLTEVVERFAHASLRFMDISARIADYELSTSNPHISIETYFRYFIPAILPEYDKALYLDSDLIIESDVAELYELDLGDSLLAAARDIDYAANAAHSSNRRMRYSVQKLGLDDAFSYFQAGVLVLNTEAFRQTFTEFELLEESLNEEYIYNDQDVLNKFCQGRVTYLPQRWNVLNDCGGRIGRLFSQAPLPLWEEFQAAYRRPHIIHYAGVEKPWNFEDCDLAERYWVYARNTPWYEKLQPRRDVLPPLSTHAKMMARASAVAVARRVAGHPVVLSALPPTSRRRTRARTAAVKAVQLVRKIVK